MKSRNTIDTEKTKGKEENVKKIVEKKLKGQKKTVRNQLNQLKSGN